MLYSVHYPLVIAFSFVMAVENQDCCWRIVFIWWFQFLKYYNINLPHTTEDAKYLNSYRKESCFPYSEGWRVPLLKLLKWWKNEAEGVFIYVVYIDMYLQEHIPISLAITELCIYKTLGISTCPLYKKKWCKNVAIIKGMWNLR